ncbi:FtsQ-type POTRA domain-containing protein [bacterium]|nr:FtsQ-type POTRA domain-containing protein [bacterium]
MKNHQSLKKRNIQKAKTFKKVPLRSRFFPVISTLFFFGGIFLILAILFQVPKYFSKPIDKSKITIHGQEVLNKEIIINQMNISDHESWFSIDPFVISSRLRKHPWIDFALVHKKPDLGLEITITERRPIAYLKTKDNLFFLGNDYLVLNMIPSVKIWNLVVIVNSNLKGIKAGDFLPETEFSKPFRLIELLNGNQALPLNTVSEIIVDDPLNIKIVTMPDGVIVNFGFSDFDSKLTNLYFSLPRLKDERNRLDYIDLRHERGVIIKRKSG